MKIIIWSVLIGLALGLGMYLARTTISIHIRQPINLEVRLGEYNN